MRELTEDYFGMGAVWKQHKAKAKWPDLHSTKEQCTSTAVGQATESVPAPDRKPSLNNVAALLVAIAHPKTDAHSFGDAYQCPHDGNTAKTNL